MSEKKIDFIPFTNVKKIFILTNKNKYSSLHFISYTATLVWWHNFQTQISLKYDFCKLDFNNAPPLLVFPT